MPKPGSIARLIHAQETGQVNQPQEEEEEERGSGIRSKLAMFGGGSQGGAKREAGERRGDETREAWQAR